MNILSLGGARGTIKLGVVGEAVNDAIGCNSIVFDGGPASYAAGLLQPGTGKEGI